MRLRPYGIISVIIFNLAVIGLSALVVADLLRDYWSLAPISDDMMGQRPPWLFPAIIATLLVAMMAIIKLPAPTFLKRSYVFLFVGMCARWVQGWLFYGPSPMNVWLGIVTLTFFAIAIFFQVRHLRQST